jgi:tetratricopeptide (TPR) repeat protein
MTKKVLISSILLSSILLAKEGFTSYDQALKLFKEKKYKDAYEIFYSLSKSDLGNQDLNFYLGRAAYEQGEYDLAISYYDRILFLEPNNSRVKLEVAQSYLMLKNYVQAIKEFQNVLIDTKIPQNVRTNVQSKLDFINNTMQKHFFSGALIFDLSYDSNVDNSSAAGDYTIYVPQLSSDLTLSNSSDTKSDYYADTIAVLNHVYKYKENMTLNNNMVLFAQDYDTKKDSNIQVLSLSTNPTYYLNQDKYSSGLGLDYVRLNDKDYLKTFNFTLSNSHIFTQMVLNDITFKISKKLYDQSSDKTKDSMVYELKNTYKHKTNDYGLFTLNTSYNKEIAIETTRTDVTKETFDINVQNSLPLPLEYTLNTTIGSKKVIYKDKDVNFLNRRTDKTHSFALGFTKPITKNLILGLTGTIQNTLSNQEPYEYNKQIIKSTLIYTF